VGGGSLLSTLLVLVWLPESGPSPIPSNPRGLLFVWGVLFTPYGFGFGTGLLGSLFINDTADVLHSNLHGIGLGWMG